MEPNIIDADEKIIKELKAPPETVKRAFAAAIEFAVRRHHKTSDCVVDMDSQSADIVLYMPRHKTIIEKLPFKTDVLDHDILTVSVGITSLPDSVKALARSMFIPILEQMRAADELGVWKKQVHRMIDGVVLERHSDHVEVEARGAVAFLPKSGWIPAELTAYRRGNVLFFYVSSVRLMDAGVEIFLSRSSARLPELLLRSHLPMHRFKCTRRFIGHKSILFTDAPTRGKGVISTREKVSRELNGEIIELRSFRDKPFNT